MSVLQARYSGICPRTVSHYLNTYRTNVTKTFILEIVVHWSFTAQDINNFLQSASAGFLYEDEDTCDDLYFLIPGM